MSEIAAELRRLLTAHPDAELVREEALRKSGTSASGKVLSILNRVVGVSDLYAWAFGQRQFQEIEAVTVKKKITNDASAEKNEVAEETLIEEIIAKNEEYQKYGKLKN